MRAQVSWLWVMLWVPHAPQTLQKEKFSPPRSVCSAPAHTTGFTARPLLPDFICKRPREGRVPAWEQLSWA